MTANKCTVAQKAPIRQARLKFLAVRIDPGIHMLLRVAAVRKGQTLQEYVGALIREDLKVGAPPVTVEGSPA